MVSARIWSATVEYRRVAERKPACHSDSLRELAEPENSGSNLLHRRGGLHHANFRLPDKLDRALRLMLVIAMHRIHHSAEQAETDSNYGATFSWWDRLFGTYRTRSQLELASVRLGLTEWRDRRADALRWLLAMPFVDPAATLTRDGRDGTPSEGTKARPPS
jgi:hypothetical protein